jgi:hypothetical protein
MMQERNLENLVAKNVTTNINVSDDSTNVSSDNITMKALQKENIKEQLGVTALIATMEPATESQSSRANKQQQQN